LKNPTRYRIGDSRESFRDKKSPKEEPQDLTTTIVSSKGDGAKIGIKIEDAKTKQLKYLVRLLKCRAALNQKGTSKKFTDSFSVGMTRFELATPRPPDVYSNRTELHPDVLLQGFFPKSNAKIATLLFICKLFPLFNIFVFLIYLGGK
jgi:hypothetical protein